MTQLKIILLGVLLLSSLTFFAQNREKSLEERLTSLATRIPQLNDSIKISVSNLPIKDFINGVMKESKINIAISSKMNILITNNFSNVSVKDLLVFLCIEYNLDFTVTGNIISLKEYIPYIPPEPKPTPRPLGIHFSQDSLLAFDLRNDTLEQVVKEISRQTKENILIDPLIRNKLVTVYLNPNGFLKSMEGLATSNNLELSKLENGYFYISLPTKQSFVGDSITSSSAPKNVRRNISGRFSFEQVDSTGFSITAMEVNLEDLIKQVSSKLNLDLFITQPLIGNVSIELKNTSFEELLNVILLGTDYTFKRIKNQYTIGKAEETDLLNTHVIPLQSRSVDRILDIIPANFTSKLEIKEYMDLNSLVVVGNDNDYLEFRRFIADIDKESPVILIEVLIVDVTKSSTLSTGINAGFGDSPSSTTGTILPNPELSFSTNTLNDLINSFNGFGWVKLGNVTPNFYLSIKALETSGILKMRSTPKLATINGHEASLSIGKTEYYLEENNSIIGTQNPQNVTTRIYKPVSADLKVTIKPIVSSNDQIILDISVTQSDFTARISPDAPPGAVTRDFKSLIRVKNEEMILLGGLEEKSVNDSGTGVPLLSKIPLIKYLFSSRSREKADSKLNIFIKPTIIQ